MVFFLFPNDKIHERCHEAIKTLKLNRKPHQEVDEPGQNEIKWNLSNKKGKGNKHIKSQNKGEQYNN